MLVKCEKEIDVEELIKDLDAKSRKAPIDPKNSYVVAVNRELLANARDTLKQLYHPNDTKEEVTNDGNE